MLHRISCLSVFHTFLLNLFKSQFINFLILTHHKIVDHRIDSSAVLYPALQRRLYRIINYYEGFVGGCDVAKMLIRHLLVTPAFDRRLVNPRYLLLYCAIALYDFWFLFVLIIFWQSHHPAVPFLSWKHIKSWLGLLECLHWPGCLIATIGLLRILLILTIDMIILNELLVIWS